jgi:hypothetical protein
MLARQPGRFTPIAVTSAVLNNILDLPSKKFYHTCQMDFTIQVDYPSDFQPFILSHLSSFGSVPDPSPP